MKKSRIALGNPNFIALLRLWKYINKEQWNNLGMQTHSCTILFTSIVPLVTLTFLDCTSVGHHFHLIMH